jgi:hypothetical protein
MRHSSIDLTMNVYTDPKLLDVQSALNMLPAFPLDGRAECTQLTLPAIEESLPSTEKFAPGFAPTPGHAGHSLANLVNLAIQADESGNDFILNASATPVEEKALLSSSVDRWLSERAKRLELSTSSLGNGEESTNLWPN